MKIFVKAKPGAKVARVVEETAVTAGLFNEEKGDAVRRFVVSVKEPATDGRANRAIEAALAEHFGVAPSRVRIVRGQTSREKIVEIL